jgi:hypothetical protein
MRILRNLGLLTVLGAAVFIVLEILISVGILDDYSLQILCTAGINIMVALSLNLISPGFLPWERIPRAFCFLPTFLSPLRFWGGPSSPRCWVSSSVSPRFGFEGTTWPS